MGTMRERQRAGPAVSRADPVAGAADGGVARGPGRGSGRRSLAGVKTEDAAREAGVSSPVGFRWFRHAGGVNPCLPPTVSGRYLSFAEREDIALLRAQELGVREIARRLGRDPVDDLAGAAPQRVDADVAARLQGVDRAVARRAARPPAEGREAGRQRTAAGVRAGPARRATSATPTADRAGPDGAGVEGSQQAASTGPAVGAGLEPGADRAPAQGRLPR